MGNQQLLASIMGIIFLGEIITASLVLGGAPVLSGIYLVQEQLPTKVMVEGYGKRFGIISQL
jgi:hypothetical protein